MVRPQSQSFNDFPPYEHREVELQADTGSGELGRQKNTTADTRVKITQKEFFGKIGVIGTVARVCYGQYQTKPACLAVFNFSFLSRNTSLRFKGAEIAVTFEPMKGASPSKESPYPVIRRFSPRKVHGIATVEEETGIYNVVMQCGVPHEVPIRAVQATHASKDSHLRREPFMEILGKLWSEPKQREAHKVYWTMKEKGKTSYCLPDELTTGVIVEHTGPFQAVVKVTVDTSLPYRLFGFPWSKDDPVLFMPGHPKGEDLQVSQFECLTDAEWGKLVPYDQSWTTNSPPVESDDAADAVNAPQQPPIAGVSCQLEKDLVPREHQKAMVPTLSRGDKTYRVQGIPSRYNPEGAKRLLESLIGLKDLKIHSLASSPVQPNERVATITGDGLREKLTGGRERWQFEIQNDPERPSGGVLGRREVVVIDTSFEGFTPLSSLEVEGNHAIDLIVLSGLGGHAFGSFKERGGTHMWLRDDLPYDIPRARILVYGYDTHLVNSISVQDLEPIASGLRTAIYAIRSDSSAMTRPIVFLAHSLGGLVVKEALIQMKTGNERDKMNLKATYGILFFGVPHQGMDISSFRGMVEGQVNADFLATVNRDSPLLRNQAREFPKAFDFPDSKVVSFYETQLSHTAQKGPAGWAMTGNPALLVNQASATHGRPWENEAHHMQGVNRSHSDMVKLYPNDPIYYTIREILKDFVQEAEEVISARFSGMDTKD